MLTPRVLRVRGVRRREVRRGVSAGGWGGAFWFAVGALGGDVGGAEEGVQSGEGGGGLEVEAAGELELDADGGGDGEVGEFEFEGC